LNTKNAGLPAKPHRERRAQRHTRQLAFGELEPLTSALLTVLLALVTARIASEEARLLEALAQLTVELDQGASDSKTDRIGLTRDSTTMGEDQNIELVGHLRDEQGLTHRDTPGFGREILLEGTSVDRNVALSGPEEHTGDRLFAAAGSKMLLNLRCWHS